MKKTHIVTIIVATVLIGGMFLVPPALMLAEIKAPEVNWIGYTQVNGGLFGAVMVSNRNSVGTLFLPRSMRSAFVPPQPQADQSGNTTNVDYPTSIDLRFTYDALNPLTDILAPLHSHGCRGYRDTCEIRTDCCKH